MLGMLVSKSILSQFVRTVRYCSTFPERHIPRTLNEYQQLKDKQILQPENAALVRVAIIGCPNVGKSTLLNQLVNRKVSAASPKVHTTRDNVIGVYMHNNVQVVFVDTPGLVDQRHMKRHNLDSAFQDNLEFSIIKADVLCVVCDVANKRERTKLNRGLIHLLHSNRDKESILVINKVDCLKKKMQLLDIVHTLSSGFVGGQQVRHAEDSLRHELQSGQFQKLFDQTEKILSYKDKEQDEDGDAMPLDHIGWPNFSRVFMVSALHDDGIGELRDYLLTRARPQPWAYSSECITPRNPRNLIIDCLREVCLKHFRQEIPYQFQFNIVLWETDDLGTMFIAMDLYCPRKFQAMVIGPQGTAIATIKRECRNLLSDTFQCDVSLKIKVKSFFNAK